MEDVEPLGESSNNITAWEFDILAAVFPFFFRLAVLKLSKSFERFT